MGYCTTSTCRWQSTSLHERKRPIRASNLGQVSVRGGQKGRRSGGERGGEGEGAAGLFGRSLARLEPYPPAHPCTAQAKGPDWALSNSNQGADEQAKAASGSSSWSSVPARSGLELNQKRSAVDETRISHHRTSRGQIHPRKERK